LRRLSRLRAILRPFLKDFRFRFHPEVPKVEILDLARVPSSERQQRELPVWSRDSPKVIDIAGCDHGRVELQRRCDNESIHRVSRRHACLCEQRAGPLCDRTREIYDTNCLALQEAVDRRVKQCSTADFC
jgi:hypothetical protein